MQSRTIAYGMSILSMLIWGTLALFVKPLGNFTSAEIVLARIIFGMFFLGLVYFFTKKKSPKENIRRNLLKMLLSGACMGFNWVCLFEAYRWVDVSIATLCYYMAPVFVVFGSLIFFRQKLNLMRIAGIVAALAGMLITTGAVMGGADPTKGVLFALTSAVLYGSVTLFVKSVKGLTGLEITLVQLAGALVVVLPYALLTHEGPWIAPTMPELGSMATLGLVHTGVALFLYFSSVQLLPVQSSALLSYIDPLSALAFAAIFLGDRMSAVQWLGAALILGGALFGELMGNRKK